MQVFETVLIITLGTADLAIVAGVLLVSVIGWRRALRL